MEEIPNTQANQKLGEQEDWEEEDEYDDEDIDKEAQEIARRLGEQLWADISKVNAERNAQAANALLSVATGHPNGNPQGADSAFQISLASNQNKKKEEAVISTMTSILTLVEKDPQAKAILLSVTVPDGRNVLELLYQCTASRHIAKGVAGPLSQIIVSLAKSEILFGNLRQSNAAALQLNIGKRKREALDEDQSLRRHPYKRPYIPDNALHQQVVEAVRIISQTLGGSSAEALDPSRVSSVRLQLHQVFLFAVTSAAVAGPNMHALQEIGGLIQVIGVLSGIQIGHSPSDTNMASGPSPLPSDFPGQQSPSVVTDIGTAVYPCLVAGCGMTFSRLYNLRAHQRSHAAHRPHRCNLCPASFARSHDLKRHVKLHDRKAWECQGCHKVFSRRDAIKRHKNGIKNRGMTNDICLTAEVIEVQLDDAEAEAALREERRAKLWSGIAVTEATGTAPTSVEYGTADGVIDPAVVLSIQSSILSLHHVLQTLVGNSLGNAQGHPSPLGVDSLAGQATLASVIARAQLQSLPISSASPSRSLPDQPSMNVSNPDALTVEGIMPEPIGETSNVHRALPTLSMYGLSDEQTRLLEIAVANAAAAAQAQAEAEAAMEEEREGDDDDNDDEDNDGSDMEQDKPEENSTSCGL